MTTDDKGALDINGIMGYLPHRYPFLLVDRVLECVPGKTLTAIKNVTMNEPFFAGHFPGHPVMPGVLVIEALAQASAILAYRTPGPHNSEGAIFLFAGIDGVRFRRQVAPGDQLLLEVSVMRIVRGVGKFAARATVAGEMAAEGELMAALRPGTPGGSAAPGA
jgi:3-hydroxyacyl-[acyl-carrier-protein] dehydratase